MAEIESSRVSSTAADSRLDFKRVPFPDISMALSLLLLLGLKSWFEIDVLTIIMNVIFNKGAVRVC